MSKPVNNDAKGEGLPSIASRNPKLSETKRYTKRKFGFSFASTFGKQRPGHLSPRTTHDHASISDDIKSRDPRLLRTPFSGPLGWARSSNTGCGWVDIHLANMSDSTWQEAKKATPQETNKRRTSESRVHSSALLKLVIPWYISAQSQSKGRSVLEFTTQSVEVRTSVLGCVILQANKAFLRVKMPNPEKWNDYRTWSVHCDVLNSTVNVLREHSTIFSDLAADWGTNAEDIEAHRFVPCVYDIHVLMSSTALVFGVNKDNVMDAANDLENDHHAVLDIPECQIEGKVPFEQYKSTQSSIPFKVVFASDKDFKHPCVGSTTTAKAAF